MAFVCGIRGCAGRTKRRGQERYCAQLAVMTHKGKTYCYYHNPADPKQFGEGYVRPEDRLAQRRTRR